ncbi:MAG TPA: CCA tRNA nucleotidyltransferase [Pseudogracilibacillus sp.]|nr:CCA tRNA nucleotidyltransferase [Pseudogracilibacillus sp.]
MNENKSKISPAAKEVLKIIESHQFQAYFVGGCVRDSLLKKDITDIDIATSASPEEIMDIFSAVIPIGLEHGTVLVRHQQESYEITTFRTESTYSNQRHPDKVVFVTDIKEDLARRDFTINAMAMNYRGELVDPFFGQTDLQQRLIRTVRQPEERFQEDALRIIRALRFSSQLGFTIDKAALIEMKRLAPSLEQISVERITQEMEKFFQGDAIQSGLQYLKETKIACFLPILKKSPQLVEQIPEKLTPFQSFGEVIAFFYLLDPTYSIAAWTKAWKCSNKEKNVAKHLVENVERWLQEGRTNWLVYNLEEACFSMFIHLLADVYNNRTLRLQELLYIKEKLPILSRKELCIDGKWLQNHFIEKKSGPWIGQVLQEIEYLVVTGQLNNNLLEIKEWIQCHPPESD